MSFAMPPPNAITALERSAPSCTISSAIASTDVKRFDSSPPGKNSGWPPLIADPCSYQTSRVVAINTLPALAGMNSETLDKMPRSTTTG
jgi:hypothetical protein